MIDKHEEAILTILDSSVKSIDKLLKSSEPDKESLRLMINIAKLSLQYFENTKIKEGVKIER